MNFIALFILFVKFLQKKFCNKFFWRAASANWWSELYTHFTHIQKKKKKNVEKYFFFRNCSPRVIFRSAGEIIFFKWITWKRISFTFTLNWKIFSRDFLFHLFDFVSKVALGAFLNNFFYNVLNENWFF